MSNTSNPSILTTSRGYNLKYHYYKPERTNISSATSAHAMAQAPILFCGGFKSDMTGSKAIFLQELCEEQQRPYIRFDYYGHGISDGKFADGTIGQWRADTSDMIELLYQDYGKIIIIGSSMGGWLSLLNAEDTPAKIAAIIGIAAAPDFVEYLLWRKFSPKQKSEVMNDGVTMVPSCYWGEPYPISKKLIEEASNNMILNKGAINIYCPVRLLHGLADEDVPYEYSSKIAQKLISDDVQILFDKSADHRFSEPENLETLKNTILALDI